MRFEGAVVAPRPCRGWQLVTLTCLHGPEWATARGMTQVTTSVSSSFLGRAFQAF